MTTSNADGKFIVVRDDTHQRLTNPSEKSEAVTAADALKKKLNEGSNSSVPVSVKQVLHG